MSDPHPTGSGPQRLAVYGTLVPGGANAGVLADLPGEWTRGTVAGTRHDDGWPGYPGLVLAGGGDAAAGDDSGSRVPVHVLHSPGLAAHLERLDEFEGPGYERVVASVRLEDGAAVEAWIYTLVDPPH